MDPRLRAYAEADPQGFAKLARQLQERLLVPHSGGQQDVMASKARFQVLCAGRRWGKTKVGVARSLRVTRRSNKMVWWVAPTYKVVKRGYREAMKQCPPDMLTHPMQAETAFDAGRAVVWRFKNGSRLEFYSAERPEGMLGEGVDFAVLDEAATMPQATWLQIVRPTLMDNQGHALHISTPRGRNWFYYLWLRGQNEEDEGYASWQFPSWTNPTLEPGEIEDMRDSLPLVLFEQEVEAKFVSSASSVFRYNDEVIVGHRPPQGHVVVGVDLAKKQDFTVLSAARADDWAPCGFDRFNEISWPIQRNRIKQFCKDLRQGGATHITLVMDSGGPGDPIVDDMEAAGYDVVPISFKKWKHNMVVQLSKDLEDGYARLSPEFLTEFENYTYTLTDAGNYTYSAPEGQHDDVVSAKLLQHHGLVEAGAPNITKVSAYDPEDEDELRGGEYEGGDDWSDLIDEADTGIPELQVLKPDSIRDIMARESAWGRW